MPLFWNLKAMQTMFIEISDPHMNAVAKIFGFGDPRT